MITLRIFLCSFRKRQPGAAFNFRRFLCLGGFTLHSEVHLYFGTGIRYSTIHKSLKCLQIFDFFRALVCCVLCGRVIMTSIYKFIEAF